MTSLPQLALDFKRGVRDQARQLYEDAEQDLQDFQEDLPTLEQYWNPSQDAARQPFDVGFGTLEEERARQVVELLIRSGGMLSVPTIAAALGLSSEETEAFLEDRLQSDLHGCPWCMLTGEPTLFILRSYLHPMPR